MEEKTGESQARQPGCFICTTAIPMLERWWSESTNDHFRNSRVEFLKGLRSLLDARIERLTRHAEAKGTSVPVD